MNRKTTKKRPADTFNGFEELENPLKGIMDLFEPEDLSNGHPNGRIDENGGKGNSHVLQETAQVRTSILGSIQSSGLDENLDDEEIIIDKPEFRPTKETPIRYEMYPDIPMAIIGAGIESTPEVMLPIKNVVKSVARAVEEQARKWDSFWHTFKDKQKAPEPEYTSYPEEFDSEVHLMRPMEKVLNFDEFDIQKEVGRQRSLELYIRKPFGNSSGQDDYSFCREDTPSQLEAIRGDIISTSRKERVRSETPTEIPRISETSISKTSSSDQRVAITLDGHKGNSDDKYETVDAGQNMSPFTKVLKKNKTEGWRRFQFWK